MNQCGCVYDSKDQIQQLLIGAALQDFDRVKYLLEVFGLHPDSTIDGKPTALCYAVLKPNLNLVEHLIQLGADVNKSDGMGMTPLHYAAVGGCNYCVSILISRGAEINAVNSSGRTPASLAWDRRVRSDNYLLLKHHGGIRWASDSADTGFH